MQISKEMDPFLYKVLVWDDDKYNPNHFQEEGVLYINTYQANISNTFTLRTPDVDTKIISCASTKPPNINYINNQYVL